MPPRLFKLGDWIYIAPVALIAFALGVYGFTTCGDCGASGLAQPGARSGLVQAVTHTLGLMKGTGGFPLDREHWPLFLAQILMPAFAFVSVFKIALQNIRRDARVVLARRLRGHTIVCGIGAVGRQIVESFCDAGKSVLAITLDTGTPDALACERRGVLLLQGDASETSLLQLAGLKHADALILACGSDGMNLEIGMRARDALKGVRESPIRILPQLRSEWLYESIEKQRNVALGSATAEFQPFNLNANAARALLGSEAFLRAMPQADTPSPHLLVCGFGRMGAELIVRAARCNFALPGQRLSATVLDRGGAASVASAEIKSPHFREIADIEFRACTFAMENASWHETVRTALNERMPFAVVIALSADDVALHSATELRKILDESECFGLPVFVRVWEQARLAEFLAQLEGQSAWPDRLMPFGDLASLTSPAILLDQSLDALARALHRVWLESVPDKSSPAAVSWEKLPEFYKQANRVSADYIPIRLRYCGMSLRAGAEPWLTFSDAEVEALAALEHWRWCVEMRSLGWRYSQERDNLRKRHDRMAEWDALPEEAKAYNREMARRIPEIAAAAGMTIKRDGAASRQLRAPGRRQADAQPVRT